MKLFLNFVLLLILFQGYGQTKHQITNTMNVAVWDTYVTKKDGSVMHFDIIAPEEITDTVAIYNYGREYLKIKGQDGQTLSSKQCKFCHIETIKTHWKEAINKNGYFIIEMENCNE